jgi:YHS domain-containing protein
MNQLAMSTTPHHHGEHHAADGDAICPVCRARVDSRTAPSRAHDGETWFFCDDRCLRAFEGRPDFYVARARNERAQDGRHAAG